MRLSPAQVRVLRCLDEGGVLLAALRETDDYLRDDVLLSESVGIVVLPGPPPYRRERGFRVRNQTAAPLYLDGLIDHPECAGGLREFRITDAGRRQLVSAQH